MDSQRFRNQTHPVFTPITNEDTLRKAAERLEVPNKHTMPIDDPRYPGYASIMGDGRLITEYKPHCADNVVTSEHGNSFRIWLQHNADGIIQVSRKRQAERTGAQFYSANTVIPAKQYQKCDQFECTITRTGAQDSLGLERVEGVPNLFGTFSEPNQSGPSARVQLNTIYEGGRNSIRGREYVPLGLKSFDPRKSKYGASG